MRSYLLSGACAASMLLALTPTAQAADLPPEPAGWNWYVSVFGGWSIPDDVEVSFDNYYNSLDYNLEGEISLDDGFMGGAALGGQFNEWLRGEVEVSGHWHDVDDDETFSYSVIGSGLTYSFAYPHNIDGDVNALFILANVWVDVPVGDVIRPYIGGGVGVGVVDADLSISYLSPGGPSGSFIDDSDWGFAFQVGGGVAFDIMPNLAVDVGYRYKGINAKLDIDGGTTAFFTPLSDTDFDYRSHNLLLGLRFTF